MLTSEQSSTTSAGPQPTSCSIIAKPYTASNGKVFNPECNIYWITADAAIITDTIEFDYKACVDKCASLDSCVAVTFAKTNAYSNGTVAYNECYTLNSIASGDRGTDNNFDRATLSTQPSAS